MIIVVDSQMKLKSFSWNKLKIIYTMQLFINQNRTSIEIFNYQEVSLNELFIEKGYSVQK